MKGWALRRAVVSFGDDDAGGPLHDHRTERKLGCLLGQGDRTPHVALVLLGSAPVLGGTGGDVGCAAAARACDEAAAKHRVPRPASLKKRRLDSSGQDTRARSPGRALFVVSPSIPTSRFVQSGRLYRLLWTTPCRGYLIGHFLNRHGDRSDPNPTEPHPLLSTLRVAALGMLRGAFMSVGGEYHVGEFWVGNDFGYA